MLGNGNVILDHSGVILDRPEATLDCSEVPRELKFEVSQRVELAEIKEDKGILSKMTHTHSRVYHTLSFCLKS